MPVPQLQRLIDSAHFTELLAADRLGLVPDSWQQAGTIAAVIANQWAGKGKSYQPDDFIPRVRIRKSAAEQELMMRSLSARMGRASS